MCSSEKDRSISYTMKNKKDPETETKGCTDQKCAKFGHLLIFMDIFVCLVVCLNTGVAFGNLIGEGAAFGLILVPFTLVFLKLVRLCCNEDDKSGKCPLFFWKATTVLSWIFFIIMTAFNGLFLTQGEDFLAVRKCAPTLLGFNIPPAGPPDPETNYDNYTESPPTTNSSSNVTNITTTVTIATTTLSSINVTTLSNINVTTFCIDSTLNNTLNSTLNSTLSSTNGTNNSTSNGTNCTIASEGQLGNGTVYEWSKCPSYADYEMSIVLNLLGCAAACIVYSLWLVLLFREGKEDKENSRLHRERLEREEERRAKEEDRERKINLMKKTAMAWERKENKIIS